MGPRGERGMRRRGCAKGFLAGRNAWGVGVGLVATLAWVPLCLDGGTCLAAVWVLRCAILGLIGSSRCLDGPSPCLDGPSPCLDGPSPYLDGPSPCLDGPSPCLDGPSPCLDGPSPCLDGPSLCLDGPSRSPIGSAPHSVGGLPAPGEYLWRCGFGLARWCGGPCPPGPPSGGCCGVEFGLTPAKKNIGGGLAGWEGCGAN